jgi:hypothetical protein
MRYAWFAITMLVVSVIAGPSLAQSADTTQSDAASSPIGGDSQYTLALGGPPMGPRWSGADEVWLRRNRRIAIVGKVLTVLGVSLVASQLQRGNASIVISGLGAQYLGQLTWSAAELRAAKHMRRRGFRISKAPAIAAMCGALLLSPVTWIAGPIQSAQVRRAHRELELGSRQGAAFSSYGLGFRGVF